VSTRIVLMNYICVGGGRTNDRPERVISPVIGPDTNLWQPRGMPDGTRHSETTDFIYPTNTKDCEFRADLPVDTRLLALPIYSITSKPLLRCVSRTASIL